MRLRPWVLVAMCMASAAHGEDWLEGDHDVMVPHHPAPSRFVLVITQDADGRYRDGVFVESVDRATGRLLKRRVPPAPGADTGVRLLSEGERAQTREPDLLTTKVRSASVDGLLPCRIPEGTRVSLGGRSLQPGHFGAGMRVGLIEVRKRPDGPGAYTAPTARHEIA